MKRFLLSLNAFLLIAAIWVMPSPARAAEEQSPIKWEKWSDDVFARAKKENKFVLMDLEAIWCHWCHVMDQITYRDPEVIALIGKKYIAVKVDQDSRPDISNRYEDYGWPATVVFNADGGEIVKRQGYIPPKPMARMLQAVIDDPTPGPSVQGRASIAFGQESSLPADLRQQLQDKFDANYDAKEGGWGTIHKFLDWDAVELCMNRGRAGDKAAEQRARQTCTAALKLIDPEWGGIYQYSTDGDWVHPHFEKIMQFQAEAMRTYSMAFAQYHDLAYLKAEEDIRRFLKTFLTSPEGALYTSQNADLVDGEHSAGYFALSDAARRRLGVPRVDMHIYARENGWTINALCAAYQVTQDRRILDDAIAAANWVISHRSMAGGGFHHGDNDAAGPYLGDTLAMGRAFLSLYSVTADRAWLARASTAADFSAKTFAAPAGVPGYITAVTHGPLPPTQEFDENVAAARFFNLLGRYTGQDTQKESARNAMRYAATPSIARSRGAWGAGILLADAEFSNEPLHVTVIGAKRDAHAADLFEQALRSPIGYKRVEWWDTAEGPLPNPDVQYPQLKTAAAFLCTANTCSPPIMKVEALRTRLDRAAGM